MVIIRQKSKAGRLIVLLLLNSSRMSFSAFELLVSDCTHIETQILLQTYTRNYQRLKRAFSLFNLRTLVSISPKELTERLTDNSDIASQRATLARSRQERPNAAKLQLNAHKRRRQEASKAHAGAPVHLPHARRVTTYCHCKLQGTKRALPLTDSWRTDKEAHGDSRGGMGRVHSTHGYIALPAICETIITP